MISAQITGLQEVMLKLSEAPKKVANKVLRPAMQKAARKIRAAMREKVRVASGALKKSLAQKIYTYKGQMGVGAIVGPSRRYVAQVAENSRGRLRVLTKKKVSAGAKGQKRVPAKYAHLVERGHRIAIGGRLTRTRTGKGGRKYTQKGPGHSATSVKAYPFAEPTLREVGPSVMAMVENELRSNMGAVFGG